jgi:hypothetical protein
MPSFDLLTNSLLIHFWGLDHPLYFNLSWFYDAPLSHVGLEQVNELAHFLQSQKSMSSSIPIDVEAMAILRGDPSSPPSRLLCSNLRRAISTLAGAFYRVRLKRHPWETIQVISPLQEISRNPDTLSITPAHTAITPSWIERSSFMTSSIGSDFSKILSKHVDVSMHIGNKPISTNGKIRMNEFCNMVFTLKENHIICGGHSIWFRAFFRTYMPYTIDHICKTRKVVNCGIIAFSLLKATKGTEPIFMIDPQSVRVIYGGFE